MCPCIGEHALPATRLTVPGARLPMTCAPLGICPSQQHKALSRALLALCAATLCVLLHGFLPTVALPQCHPPVHALSVRLHARFRLPDMVVNHVPVRP